ncbi:MAG: YqaA family protein [Pseudomonadota bacterium]|nr:YqaA family protein [Pseudomonadota bacterium]
MLRRLYDWTMEMAAQKNAVWVLAAVAFVESSVFPIPPDVLLIPMVLAARNSAWRYAAICTIASVLGGMLGYAIGSGLYEGVGRPILDFYGYGAKFSDFTARYNEYGGWIVFIAGVTPFPYKVITIASGVTDLDFATFTTASVLARGLRFFVVAALLYWIGQPIREFVEKRLGLLFTIFCVLLIGGFVLIKLIA